MDRTRAADDLVISREGAVILIDPVSVNYMAGSEIDFVDDLIGASFKVNDPQAKASCGLRAQLRALIFFVVELGKRVAAAQSSKRLTKQNRNTSTYMGTLEGRKQFIRNVDLQECLAAWHLRCCQVADRKPKRPCRHRRGQPQSVFIIHGDDEPDLAHGIKSVEMISLGLEDHGLRSHAVLNAAIACSQLAA